MMTTMTGTEAEKAVATLPCTYHAEQAAEIKRSKHAENERNAELAYLLFEQGGCKECQGK